MNDPFAMLNPIDKPKTAPAYGGLPPAPVAPLHPIGGGGGFGGPSGMGMGMGGMPGGMGMGMGGGMPGGMGMGMGGGMPGNMGMGAGMPGGMGMNMGGGMGQGMGHGITPSMAPGTGMGMNMGGGMPQQQQQAPIMYDNIKNLLEQKPKPSGSMRDDAGMDFLENLGSGKANNLSVSSPTAAASSPFGSAGDPFGGPVSALVAAPTVSLAGFAFPGESATSTAAPTAVSPSNGAKSSALADRLANGRRKTQEAQRQQLGINAGAFSPSSGAPKISLKEMAPQSSSPASSATSGDRAGRTPSLEDFASGKPVFQESDPFGMSLGSSCGSSNRTTSGSSHTQPKTSSSSLAYSSSSGSAFDNDGGSLFADSDADFEKKLNGGNPGTGSARQLSSGNLGTANRTGSGGAAAKATMDFGW